MHEDPDPSPLQTVLSVVADPDCRSILCAADCWVTASEIASATDIPRSTVYRKLDRLHRAGLLETSCQLDTSGKQPTAYVRCIDRIAITVDSETFSLTLHEDSIDSSTSVFQAPPAAADADRTANLADIFVATTGTTTLVDPQEHQRRRPDQDHSEKDRQALEEYVAASIAADGLAEAIDGSDFGSPKD